MHAREIQEELEATRRNRTDPCDEKRYRGAGMEEVKAWWKTCRDWMAQCKTQCVPLIYDFKTLLKSLSDKNTAAQSEVDGIRRIVQKGGRREKVR